MFDKYLLEHKWRAALSSIPIGESEKEIQCKSAQDVKTLVTTGYQMNREKALPVKFSFRTDYDNLKVVLNVHTR
jgi:hypothetical protein